MDTVLPYCTPNGSLSMEANGSDGGIQGKEQFARNFGLLYICIGFITIPISCFVLSVFCRPPLIKHSCYKLMSFNTVLDIINLTNGALISGFLSVQNIHHCNSGMWVSYFVHQDMIAWMMYCCASEVLALNRMLEFANKNLSNFLFEGKRVYLWFGVVVAYAAVGFLLVPDKFYFYNTYGGYSAIYRLSGRFNLLHTFNNFFKFGFLTVSYSLMLIFMYRRFKTNERAQFTSLQIKVSIQTTVIAALADVTTVAYVIALNAPVSPAVSNYVGVMGELLWIALHAGTGITYLLMNGAVKQRLRLACGGTGKITPSETAPSYATNS
ncbi:hypothetical protein QR680_006812 [Steinernema hermaphroditum]|uniref:Uncharacterized protein n=1 Tax=Steinernema hermaphroditum TaxID=289476 RepID=A0AA39LXP7_9BILA|nr:hypothetical protein QR680_006812 [Steinernema hermaphroditum]